MKRYIFIILHILFVCFVCSSQNNMPVKIVVSETSVESGSLHYEINLIIDSITARYERGDSVYMQKTLPIYNHQPINDFISKIDSFETEYKYKRVVDPWNLYFRIYYDNDSIREIKVRSLTYQNSLNTPQFKPLFSFNRELYSYQRRRLDGIYNYITIDGIKEYYKSNEAIEFEVYNHSDKNVFFSGFDIDKIFIKMETYSETEPVEELHNKSCPVVRMLKSAYSKNILLKAGERKQFVFNINELCKCQNEDAKMEGVFMFSFEIKNLKKKRLSVFSSDFIIFEK